MWCMYANEVERMNVNKRVCMYLFLYLFVSEKNREKDCGDPWNIRIILLRFILCIV